ncbi:MAG TPA: hypothetical protein VMI10_12840 [Terriglobales bacterium]|nr:hypothetical protein [Terriglobales bacterium]
MIACIGWGSLIWHKRNLDVDGEWRADGPTLPVEFARLSNDGRITLVLVQGFEPVPTLWSAFNTHDLAKARESLRHRERIPQSRAAESIAHWLRGENPASEPRATISAWAAGKNLEAGVWTNLPPKFDGVNGRVPTESELVAYLQTLEGQARAAAEEYVRRAPRQIATAYRRVIERALGWTPID